MTMRLKRIELSNVRSHEHAIFEPSESGVTAIKGPTGAGKSTIVDSLPWILFGTKPQGVARVAEMYRSGATFPDDKCFARADLTIDGVEYTITRRMVSKNGGSECVVEKHVDDDSPEIVAGPAVSHAEEYIRKLLRMSDKGFLSAVFVQQKQVDNLISAAPRERAEIIEKLTGIHGLTHALDLAKQESSSLRKAVALSTVNESTVDELKEELEGVQEEKHKRASMLEAAREKHAEGTAKLDASEEKLQKLRKEVQKRVQIDDRLELLQPSLEALNENIPTLTARRTSLRERYLAASGVGDLATAEAEVEESQSELDRLKREEHSAQTQIESLEESKRHHEKALKTANVENITAARGLRKDAQARLESHGEELKRCEETRSELSAEKRSLSSAKKALAKGEGTCPTCLQTAHDPDAALRELDSRMEAVEARLKELNAEHSRVSDAIEQDEADLAAAEEHVASFEELKSITPQMKTLRGDERTATAAIKVAKSKLKNLTNRLQAVQQSAQLKDGLDEASADLDRALNQGAKYSEEIDALKAKRTGLTSTSWETVEKSEDSLRRFRQRVQKLSDGILKLEGRIGVLNERESAILRNIATEEANLERYKNLLASYQEHESSVAVVSEFRQDRIDSSLPTIEGLASNLLERFTDGLFVALKLDTKFRVRVTRNDGNEFNVGLLSGGELSSAAMALRLAIGMMLSPGATKNLLILDEVLTAQDRARSELILSTIREVYDGQVIIIAHNDSIDSIVDSTFDV